MDEDRGISGSGQTSESHAGHILESGSYFEGSGVGGWGGAGSCRTETQMELRVTEVWRMDTEESRGDVGTDSFTVQVIEDSSLKRKMSGHTPRL